MKTDDATAVGFVAVAIVELKSALEGAEDVIARAVNPDGDFETPLAPAATDARRAADLMDRALEAIDHVPTGANCSNDIDFWCSIHCPLDLGPNTAAVGVHCCWTSPRCSEHCPAAAAAEAG